MAKVNHAATPRALARCHSVEWSEEQQILAYTTMGELLKGFTMLQAGAFAAFLAFLAVMLPSEAALAKATAVAVLPPLKSLGVGTMTGAGAVMVNGILCRYLPMYFELSRGKSKYAAPCGVFLIVTAVIFVAGTFFSLVSASNSLREAEAAYEAVETLLVQDRH